MNVGRITPPNRNYAIEALRFIFICIICLWHYHDAAPWLYHGYIAVEFYFILSGFFIFRSYLKNNVSVLEFTWRKMKKFYLPFLISVILLMALDRKQYLFCSDFSADGILSTYFSHFHELFFCQSLGLTDRVAINHPLWFISVLLFGGGILYSMLKNFKQRAISFYIPLICLFGFAFVLGNGNHSLQNQENLFGLQSWMIRGLSDMGLGILTAYIYEKKKEFFNGRSILVNVAGIVSLFAMLLMTLAKGNFDYLAIFFVPLIIISSFMEKSMLNKVFSHKICLTLGGLSMYMYFIHLFVASVYWILDGKIDTFQMFPSHFLLVIYLTSVLVAAIILKKISCKLSCLIFK